MDAVLFCAWRVSLPEPLASRRPLCLMPVGNTPLLELTLGALAAAGVSRVFLVIDRELAMAPAIRAQLAVGSAPASLAVEFLPAAEGLMETMARARSALAEDFLALTRLMLAGPTLGRIMTAHRRQRNALTYFAARGVGETPPPHPVGAFCVNQAALGLAPALPAVDAASLLSALRENAARVGACDEPLDAMPVESLSELFAANMLAVRGKLPQLTLEGERLAAGVRVGEGCRIHPSARFKAPVLLGPGCRVEAGAQLGPNVVLGARAIVDRGALVRDSVLEADSYIGPGAQLEKCYIRSELLVRISDMTTHSVTDPHGLGAAPSRDPWDPLNSFCQRLLALLMLTLCAPLLGLARLRHRSVHGGSFLEMRSFVHAPPPAAPPRVARRRADGERRHADDATDSPATLGGAVLGFTTDEPTTPRQGSDGAPLREASPPRGDDDRCDGSDEAAPGAPSMSSMTTRPALRHAAVDSVGGLPDHRPNDSASRPSNALPSNQPDTADCADTADIADVHPASSLASSREASYDAAPDVASDEDDAAEPHESSVGPGAPLRASRMRVLAGEGWLPRSLPALWDVARGRLRLVGPAPVSPQEAITHKAPWSRVRFLARPGLVQPAHAFSARPLPLEQRRTMDHFYASTRSMPQDMRILWRALWRRLAQTLFR